MGKRLWIITLGLAVLALLAAGWAIYNQVTAKTEKVAAQQDAKQVADPLAALCATDPSIAARVGPANCQKAAEVQQSAAASIPGPPGVGIASVQTGDCTIRIALTDGRTSTLSNLCGPAGKDAPPARGIASTGQDGCTVTVLYTDATSAHLGPFCGPAGQAGPRGDDGKTPPCLSEPTQCRGDDGKQGAQGAGLADQRFVRLDDGTCVSRATYTDPATGRTRTDDSPAGDTACPAGETTPPTPIPTN